MSISAVITQVGLDRAIDANQSGVSIEITHIGFGTQGYTPSRSRHALSNEVVRVAIAGGKNVSANQIHLTALLESGEFACKEIGVYLSDGTLFAVSSMPNGTIFYKQELNTVMQAFDLVLDVVPTGSVTVNTSGDLSLYYAEEFAVINTSLATLQNKDLQTVFAEIAAKKIAVEKEQIVERKIIAIERVQQQNQQQQTAIDFALATSITNIQSQQISTIFNNL